MWRSLNVQHVGLVVLTASLLLSVAVAASRTQPSTYRLIGEPHVSYAQYTAWRPCLNGSLAFDFKTHEPNGMLLYAQHAPYKYIQLSLSDGALRLRLRISEKDDARGVFVLGAPKRRLNDEQWHRVTLSRQRERTTLMVDDDVTFHVHSGANLDGSDLYFGDYPTPLGPPATTANDLLVFGGIPADTETYQLSLSTAYFETRYNGFVRNVRALNCDSSHMRRLDVIASSSMRYVAEKDACVAQPCRNEGVCLASALDAFTCDCSYTQFEGRFCEKRKQILL